MECRRPDSHRRLTLTSCGGGGIRRSRSFGPPSCESTDSRSASVRSVRCALASLARAVYMSPSTSRYPVTYALASPSAPGACARYDTATGLRTLTVTPGEPARPAALPSKATNLTSASAPATCSNTSASGISFSFSLTADALVVKAGEASLRVVSLLQGRVGGAVVEPGELLAGVERLRVEALVTT